MSNNIDLYLSKGRFGIYDYVIFVNKDSGILTCFGSCSEERKNNLVRDYSSKPWREANKYHISQYKDKVHINYNDVVKHSLYKQTTLKKYDLLSYVLLEDDV